ncbi:pseudaminic acid cytidylyltransferase [Pseudomonas sp. MS19]|uniref:pseudaminic acid cytidylyltransferase n=1 Tax=Pseudomonas sp. MS19 TaxID=2579939 RepID=UPI00156277C1|nr:pseudaminic acid cytidylyltransferase [Pseudomonas sp. MS19]NRH26810.1 pseudaminic acid cytidylyltransferase [Pseudomonas sp. MS19]
MKLAVIPARGGSKRIPRKNIKNFCGKPMIAWSIEVALASGCFEHIVVSTDDDYIAEVAREYGASVPFTRPDELSGDYIGTTPVVNHAIQWFIAQGIHPTHICCLYATAPFVFAEDIQRGYELLKSSDCDFALSVASYGFPIQRAVRITKDERLEMFSNENFNTRSQDLEEAFHDAGQFYWGRAEAWLQGKMIFGSSSVPIRLPRHRVQDIDTPEDWLRAEWLFRAMKAQLGNMSE